MKSQLHRIKKILNKIWSSPTLMTWGNMISSSAKLLVLTPLILTRYNVNEIAFWYLLLTVNSFVIVIDFGFYPTFSRIVSYAFHGLKDILDIDKIRSNEDGKPNWTLMADIYGTINSTYLFLSAFVLLIIFGFTYFSIEEIIQRTTEKNTLYISYVLFSISVFISFFARKFDAVIIGTGHVAMINRWNIINNLGSTIISVLLVYFKYPLFWLALNQVLFSILLVLRNYFLERSICEGKFSSFSFFSFQPEVFRWSWGPTWKSGVLLLCSTGVNQASGFIYSHVSNSAMLASYLLSLKLVTTIVQFSQAPFYSKIPKYSGLRIASKLTELSTITAKSINKSLWLFVIGMGFLFFFGDAGLRLIKSKANLVDYKFLMLMAIVYFLERNQSMHAQIFITTNKVPFFKTSIFSAVINITIVVLFLPHLGVWVFPIAMGFSNLLINSWWNMKISVSSMQQNLLPYFRRSMAIPLIFLFILSGVRIILHHLISL